MKTKIIVLLSVLIFALGIFCACGNKESVDTSGSGSVSESVSVSDSTEKPDSTPHTHAYTFDSWVTAPGLETAGKAKMKCTCGGEKEEDVPALSNTTVWTLAADFDPCVGGNAEYSSDKYAKVTVTVSAKHDLGDPVSAKAATCVEEGHPAYSQCKKCKKYFGADGAELTTIVLPMVAHTAGTATRENEHAATCTTTGSYDEVTRCTVCNTVMKTETKTLPMVAHTPADPVQENVKNATCTVPGSYDSVVYCSVCHAEIKRDHVTGKTLPHTAGAATRENEHAATCKAEGSYEEVVKCSVCGTEMSRTTKPIAKLPHTEAAAVRENEVPATCSKEGSYDEVVYCSKCETEMSRTTKPIAKLPHTEAAAVRENEHAATCTEAGSYDDVVRCSVCKEVISSKHETIGALGHDYKTVTETITAATCYSTGEFTETVKCSRCQGVKSTETKTEPAIDHNFVDGKCSMCELSEKYAGAQFSWDDSVTNFSGVFAFNAKGVSDDAGFRVGSDYSNSKVTFTWVDFGKGELKLTVNYRYKNPGYEGPSMDPYAEEEFSEESATYYGFMDKATGVVWVGVHDNTNITNNFTVLVPSAAVLENGAKTSQLGRDGAVRAVSFTLNDDSVYSVFVMVGEKVYFGVTFTDVQGNAVEASDLKSDSPDGFTFVVKQGDKKVVSYCVKDRALEVLDDVYGTYTNGNDTLVLDGLGNATLGNKVGTYKVNENTIELSIIENEKVTEYYEVTLNGSSYTIVKPMVTVSFDCGTDHGTEEAQSVNKNIEITLPKLEDTDAEFFRGWKIGEELLGEKYTPTSDVTLTAKWAKKITISIKDEVNGDENITAGVGDKLLEVLEANHKTSHETKYFEKYQVVTGETSEEYVDIDKEWEVEDSDNGVIKIYAKYFKDVNVNVHYRGMDIADVETTIPYNGNIKQYLDEKFSYTSCVNGYKFDGWYLNSECTDQLPDTKLADNSLMDIYGKWSWAGNVSFVLGSYTFEYDPENKYWKSNNKGVDNSTAEMQIYVSTVGGIAEISFDYYCESESAERYDYLTIEYGPVWESIKAGGKAFDWNWKTLTTTIEYDPDHILTPTNSNQRVSITYKKDNSGFGGSDTAYIRNFKINGIDIFALAPLNPDLTGSYTATDGTNVTVGAGGLITIGEVSGAYSVVDGDNNVIGVTLVENGVEVYKEFTLNTEAKTCTVAKPMVNVTYNYNGHGGENKTDNVNKHIPITLPEPSADGYVFIGWYTSADFAEASKVSTLVPEADVTVYAKWVEPSVFMGSYIGIYTYYGTTIASSIYNDTNKLVVDSLGKAKVSGSSHGFSSGASIEFVMVDEAKGILNIKTSSDDTYYAVRDPETGIIFRADSAKNFATSYMYILIPEDIYSGETSTSDLRNNLKISSWGSNYATRALEYTDKNGVKHNYLLNSADAFFNVTFTDYAGNTVAAADCSKCKTTLLVKKGDDVVVKFAYNGSSLVAADNYLGVYTCDGEDDLFLNGGGIATLGDKSGKSGKYELKSGTENVFEVTFADAFYEITVDFAGKTYEKATLPISITYVYNGHGEPENNLPDSAFKNTKFDVRPDPTAEGYTFRGWYTDEALTKKVSASQLSSATDMTLYAKWDAAATVVYYDGDVVVKTLNNCEYYENDTVGTNTDNKDYKLDTVEGVKRFVGWFLKDDNGDFGAKVTSSTVIALENAFYAKWEAAVTLTFDYNGQGTEAVVVSGKYVNDKVSDIPAVGADVTFEGKVFAGWFLKNADGSFGDAASTSVVLEGDMTYYAKWVFAPESLGTYQGWNMDGSFEKTAETLKDILIVEANGTFKLRISNNSTLTTGTLTDEQAAVTDGVMLLDNAHYVYFNKELGLVWAPYRGTEDGVNNDTYIGLDMSRVKSFKYSGCKGAVSYIAMFEITYQDDTVKTAFLFNSKIVANVTWNEGVDVTAICKQDFTVKVNGVTIAKVVAKVIIESDGLAGTYTGEYGDVVVDGVGGIAVGGANGEYTIIDKDAKKIQLVAANAMRVITLGDGTYAKALDGYQGTYTLPDNNTTITLDGYGGAGNGKTYVVNGTNITIYDGETSTSYGLDVANKKFLGKSIFAGLTFSGTYYSEWDRGVCGLRIKFDNSSSISGIIYSGSSTSTSYYFNFTAELDGNSIVFTLGRNVDGDSKIGKTIKATISGDTITFVKGGTYSSNVYTFTNQGYAKCEGFSL